MAIEFKEGDKVKLRPRYEGMHDGGYEGIREIKYYGDPRNQLLVIFRDESTLSGSTGTYVSLLEKWTYASCIHIGGE